MTAVLASPVYTIGSWQGNVTDDHGVDWVVTGEDGWSSSPPIRPVQEEKSSGDGSFSGPGYYASRVVTLSGKAIAPSQVEMLRAKDRLKAALQPRTPMDLLVEELHMARTARVRLTDQVDVKDDRAHAFDWSFTVTAPDPRRYATSPQIDSTGLPSAVTAGRTYPRSYPFVYGGDAADGSGSALLFLEGNFEEIPALITFYGPVTTPQVTHVETNRTLSFGVDLAEGDSLAVNLLNETATLNGASPRASTLSASSAWFFLSPGRNELQFRGQPGTGSTPPLMTVSAASAWT